MKDLAAAVDGVEKDIAEIAEENFARINSQAIQGVGVANLSFADSVSKNSSKLDMDDELLN